LLRTVAADGGLVTMAAVYGLLCRYLLLMMIVSDGCG
jgi:hypothetical protein